MTASLGVDEAIKAVHLYATLAEALDGTVQRIGPNTDKYENSLLCALSDGLKRQGVLLSQQLKNLINVIFFDPAADSQMHIYSSHARTYLQTVLKDLTLQARENADYATILTNMRLGPNQLSRLTKSHNPFQGKSITIVPETTTVPTTGSSRMASNNINIRKRSINNGSDLGPTYINTLSELEAKEILEKTIIFTLENFLTTDEFLEDNSYANVNKPRKKRQLLELFLGAGGLTLATLNRIQLSRLQAAMKGQQQQLSLLHQETRLNHNAIEQIKRALNHIVPTLLETAKAVVDSTKAKHIHVMSLYLESLLSHCQELIDGLSHQIDALHHNKLSYKWAQALALENTIAELKDKADEYNLRLYDESPYSLFRFRCHLALIGNKPKLVIRVPMKSSQGTLRAYRYENRPFDLQGLKIQLRTSEEVLVLDNPNSVFKTLTFKQWQKCLSFKENLHFCPAQDQIFEKQPSDNCLARLYLAKMDKIHDFCDFKISTLREKITQIGENEFYIEPFEVPLLLSIKCESHRNDKQLVLDGPQKVSLEHSCTGITDSHTFSPTWHFEINTKITPVVLSLKPEVFLNFASNDSLPTLRKLVDKLKAERPLQDLGFKQLEEAYLIQENKVMHSLYNHRYEAVMAAFFVIVVILVIFAACSKKLRHCRTRDVGTADASCSCCCGPLPWRSSSDDQKGYQGESGTLPDNSGGVVTIAGSSPSAPPPVQISGNTIHVAPEAMGELVKGSNPSFSGFKINNRFRSADTSSKRATAEAVP